MRRVDSLEKTLMLGGIGGQEEKGTTEDEIAEWHHWLDGHESEWTPGVGDGQGGLACCDSWGHKELDRTQWLIWSDLWRLWKFPLLYVSYLFVHLFVCFCSIFRHSPSYLCPWTSYLRDTLPLAQEFLELSHREKCFPNTNFYIMVQVMKITRESSSFFFIW